MKPRCDIACDDAGCPWCGPMRRLGMTPGTRINWAPAGARRHVVTVAAQKPPARRPLACVHLGRVLKRAGCGTCRRDDVRHCEAGHGEVSQNGRCDAVHPNGSFVCGDYQADG